MVEQRAGLGERPIKEEWSTCILEIVGARHLASHPDAGHDFAWFATGDDAPAIAPKQF
jgi:hypothetical protein